MQSDLWSEEDQQRLKSIFKLAARVCTCHSGKRLSDVLRPHHLCVLVPVLLQPPHWQPARFHQGKRGCSRAVDQIQWYTINTLNQILFLKSLMFLPKKRHLYDSTYYPLSCQAPQHHKEHTDCTISTSKDCILSSKGPAILLHCLFEFIELLSEPKKQPWRNQLRRFFTKVFPPPLNIFHSKVAHLEQRG